MPRAHLHPFLRMTWFMITNWMLREANLLTKRGPYVIVGSHSDNNNYILQTFIDQKVQRSTRNVNDLRPFLDTDDSDKIDTSDDLPFPQLLPSLIPTSGGDTTTARKPRGRGRPLGSKNKKKTTTRRTESSISKNS
jgi:hypothetical protein